MCDWQFIFLLLFFGRAGSGARILWEGGNNVVIKFKSYLSRLMEWTSSVTRGRTWCSNLLILSSTTNFALLLLLLLEGVM